MKKLFASLIIFIGFMSSIIPMGQKRPSGHESPAKRQKVVRSPSRIKIQTADGQEFAVPKEIVEQIPVINNLIGDIGQSEAIPLPVVQGAAFDWIIKNLERFYKNLPVDTQGLSVDQLIDVVNACEFLELEDLQAIVFKTLNKHPLLREASFVAMNDTALNKFWKQNPIYLYIAGFFYTSIRVSQQRLELNDMIAAENKLILWSVKAGIRFLDLNNLNYVHPLEKEKVSEVVVSLKGNTLASRFSEAIEQEGQPLQPQRNEILKIWNLNDLNKVPQVLDHLWIDRHDDETEFGIILNPDGTQLVARSAVEGLLKIWNLQNLAEDPRDLPHAHVSHVTISADGTMLVSSSFDEGTIKIWNMNDLDEEPSELVHERVSSTVVSSNGKLISWSTGNGILEIWDMKDLDQPSKQLQFKSISNVMVSSDGNKLVAWSQRNRIIEVWNLNNLDQKPERTYFRSTDVPGFRLSLDGKKLIVWWHNSGTIEIRDLNNLDQKLQAFRHKNVSDVIESLDGRKLISWSSEDQSIKIWDMDVIGEFENLNADQIQLIMWLHKFRKIEQMDQLLLISIPENLKPTYASLSDSLKIMLKKLVPISAWIVNL